jgi:hypothetical protein
MQILVPKYDNLTIDCRKLAHLPYLREPAARCYMGGTGSTGSDKVGNRDRSPHADAQSEISEGDCHVSFA